MACSVSTIDRTPLYTIQLLDVNHRFGRPHLAQIQSHPSFPCHHLTDTPWPCDPSFPWPICVARATLAALLILGEDVVGANGADPVPGAHGSPVG